MVLKAIFKPTFALRVGGWACICMRKRRLPDALRARIRPWSILGCACWCDRRDIG